MRLNAPTLGVAALTAVVMLLASSGANADVLTNVQLQPLEDDPTKHGPAGLCLRIGAATLTTPLQPGDPVLLFDCTSPASERQLFSTDSRGHGLIATVNGQRWAISVSQDPPDGKTPLTITRFTGALSGQQDFVSFEQIGQFGNYLRFRYNNLNTMCLDAWGFNHSPGAVVGTFSCQDNANNSNFNVLQGPIVGPILVLSTTSDTRASATAPVDPGTQASTDAAARDTPTSTMTSQESQAISSTSSLAGIPTGSLGSSSSPGGSNAQGNSTNNKPILISQGVSAPSSPSKNLTSVSDSSSSSNKVLIIGVSVAGAVLVTTVFVVLLVLCVRIQRPKGIEEERSQQGDPYVAYGFDDNPMKLEQLAALHGPPSMTLKGLAEPSTYATPAYTAGIVVPPQGHIVGNDNKPSMPCQNALEADGSESTTSDDNLVGRRGGFPTMAVSDVFENSAPSPAQMAQYPVDKKDFIKGQRIAAEKIHLSQPASQASPWNDPINAVAMKKQKEAYSSARGAAVGLGGDEMQLPSYNQALAGAPSTNAQDPNKSKAKAK